MGCIQFCLEYKKLRETERKAEKERKRIDRKKRRDEMCKSRITYTVPDLTTDIERTKQEQLEVEHAKKEEEFRDRKEVWNETMRWREFRGLFYRPWCFTHHHGYFDSMYPECPDCTPEDIQIRNMDDATLHGWEWNREESSPIVTMGPSDYYQGSSDSSSSSNFTWGGPFQPNQYSSVFGYKSVSITGNVTDEPVGYRPY